MEWNTMTTIEETLVHQYGRLPGLRGLVNYCIINNISAIPQCAASGCNNPTSYNKAYTTKGFAQYCGPVCSRKSKTVSPDVLEKLKNKTWLTNQRITLRKSKDQIALELGVSTTPVNKWLKFHNINIVSYNQSDCRVLHDKDSMEEMYSENKVSEVAQLLNVSTSTVSRFLQKHGIKTRPSNSYERTISNRSQGEKQICDMLDNYNVKYVTNDRTTGTEFDIIAGNLAIEYNGLYYHSERFKQRSFHVDKNKVASDNDLIPFHVWEDDWLFKNDTVKSTLLHKLGKTPHTIPARKCVIGSVQGSNSRLFLENNHLQGYSSASVKLGLYYDDELVALMTFSKPRFNKHYQWELVRFCTKNYTHIPGAFSKIFKHFTDHYDGNIITYADLSYSLGNVYVKNGFKSLHTNLPSYSYVAHNRRVSRTKFMKKNLGEFDSSMTERLITKHLNITKIWNCGTQAYGYNQP